jgi:predicted permease
VHWLAHLAADVRQAFRAIRRAPGVAAVVMVSIGAGIGVNTTVFSWIQARLLTPIPGVAHSSDFYLIEPRNENGGYPGASWPEYQDLTERLSAFASISAFNMAPLNVGAAEWSERTYGILASGNYFSALGLQAAAGRLLLPGDTSSPRSEPIVVVSHRYWQTRLAGRPDVVGQTVRLNDRQFTVVGVAPSGFVGTVMGLTFDLWIPVTAANALADGPDVLEDRTLRGYQLLGALKPGATIADAKREVESAMQTLAQIYPATNSTMTAEILEQWQSPRGPQRALMAALAILQAVMLLVLAAVAGNTTNLVLARASARQREAAVRLALGASRWRVMRLMLTETTVLALGGAAIGVLIAIWGTEAMRAVPMPTPQGMQVSFFTSIDTTSLLFACALGLLAGIVIGLPPAWQLAHARADAAFRAGGSVSGRHRLRDTLLALQTAIALIVLVVAGMAVKNFAASRSSDPGFTREGVLLAAYDLRGRTREVSGAFSVEFAARTLESLRALPDVEAAALATSVPLDIHGSQSTAFVLEGRARTDGASDRALMNTVTPGYFTTMRIGIVSGHDFADLRDAAAPPQVVVNEAFVRQYAADFDPLGRRVTVRKRAYTIAGVVRDSLYNSYGEPPTAFIYFSQRDNPSPSMEIHARARSGPETGIAATVREAVHRLDPSLPLYNVRSLEAHVDSNLVFQRIPARMFMVLGPLLLGLAALGIYAVVSYGVAQRRPEIGTRIALGATSGRVTRMLVSETMQTVLLGMTGGTVIALLVGSGVLLGDVVSMALVAGIALIFLLVALAACLVPARRASQIDPMKALKTD